MNYDRWEALNFGVCVDVCVIIMFAYFRCYMLLLLYVYLFPIFFLLHSKYFNLTRISTLGLDFLIQDSRSKKTTSHNKRHVHTSTWKIHTFIYLLSFTQGINSLKHQEPMLNQNQKNKFRRKFVACPNRERINFTI